MFDRTVNTPTDLAQKSFDKIMRFILWKHGDNLESNDITDLHEMDG